MGQEAGSQLSGWVCWVPGLVTASMGPTKGVMPPVQTSPRTGLQGGFSAGHSLLDLRP